jgi:hypothetical protein
MFEVERSRGCLDILGWTRIFSNVFTIAQFSSGPSPTICPRNRMTIRASLLVDLLKTFPHDATVRGFEDGLLVMNADRTGRVVMLNDHLHVPATTENPPEGQDSNMTIGMNALTVKQTLVVRCPTCGANRKKPCELATGKRRTQSHRERHWAASDKRLCDELATRP